MKKKLILAGLVMGILFPQYTVEANDIVPIDDNEDIVSEVSGDASGDMATSIASIGFFVANEDLGVQFVVDDEGVPSVKNYEGFNITITNKNTNEVTYITSDDGLLVPFEFDGESSYEIVVASVVENY